MTLICVKINVICNTDKVKIKIKIDLTTNERHLQQIQTMRRSRHGQKSPPSKYT